MIPMPAITFFSAFVSGSLLLASASVAAEGSVTIESPKDGARLEATKQSQLVYEVMSVPSGSHVHVYVDDKEVGILRQLKGSYTLQPLSAGSRNVCVKVVNKAHTPIGLQQCVKVSVE